MATRQANWVRRIALALTVLVCCGGAEKTSKNEDWKKPWLQYQSNCNANTGPSGAAGADARLSNPCPRRVPTDREPVKHEPVKHEPVKHEHPPITKKLLEDAATALLRFRKATGRLCPTREEQRELMVGTESLELLTRYVLYNCGLNSGWTFIYRHPRTQSALTVILHNGCTVVFTERASTGPFLPSKPAPARWDRASEALDRDVLHCMTAPVSTLSVCDGDDCEETDASAWLVAHPAGQ